jgi:hypothetical protein
MAPIPEPIGSAFQCENLHTSRVQPEPMKSRQGAAPGVPTAGEALVAGWSGVLSLLRLASRLPRGLFLSDFDRVSVCADA